MRENILTNHEKVIHLHDKFLALRKSPAWKNLSPKAKMKVNRIIVEGNELLKPIPK